MTGPRTGAEHLDAAAAESDDAFASALGDIFRAARELAESEDDE